MVSVDYAPNMETGMLFPMQAETLQERITARRATVENRTGLLFKVVIGNFGAKLAECLGSQNMPSAVAQSINQMHVNANAERSKGAAQTKTQNTCASTTGTTAPNLNALQSSKRKTTAAAANDMLATQNIVKSASDQPAASPPKQGLMEGSNLTTEWTSPNMRLLQQAKGGDAPFAEMSPESIVSLLTTAMTAAECEGFFAAPATLASVISKMTQNGLIEPWCIWCNLNSEQDALARAFGPLAFSVSGSMLDDQKEAAIRDWIDGERPVMISKPSIMGFGMNFQHCRNTAFVGLNDSFEQFYQAVRRFWRFGQSKPVNCHIIASELEGATVSNIRRKEADAERMAAAMVMHMADLSSEAVRGQVRDVPDYNPQQPVKIPAFLEAA
jgi:hypothetical protein